MGFGGLGFEPVSVTAWCWESSSERLYGTYGLSFAWELQSTGSLLSTGSTGIGVIEFRLGVSGPVFGLLCYR